jgi:hypothetical protein
MASKASISEYLYRFNQPSFSNYGTIGLIQNPSARFNEEGSISFTWSSNEPYLRGSFVAQPFSWLEVSYQYADVNNQLYSDNFAFSGSQTFKDKSFDAKFKLLDEKYYLPALAVGLRDLAGTGLFSGEYVVATKLVKNIDISLGIGWGTLSGNEIENPLIRFDQGFAQRGRYAETDSQGGEFSFNSFFRGQAGAFAGFEAFVPKFKSLRVKVEYDGTNYKTEGFEELESKSRVNVGLVYPFSKYGQLKLGWVRGNTLNFGFSFSGYYKNRDPYIPKSDPIKKIKNAEVIKKLNSKNQEYLYLTALKYLQDNKIYLQSAEVSKQGSLAISYSQSKYRSVPMVAGRAIKILDQIAPDHINSFSLINVNADIELHTIQVNRESFNQHKKFNNYELLRDSVSIDNQPSLRKAHEFQPKVILPTHLWKLSPSLRTQIGGPDGFFFGDLAMGLHSEFLIQKNFSIISEVSVGLINNLDELKLASDSILPHVRTDIVQYMKQSSDLHIDRMQANYFFQPSSSIYTKISAGYLETMFAGFGFEALYRPFESNYAVGVEAWRVQQRSYEMLFDFRDYKTTTGHLTFYYREPRTDILLKLKGGRYLAEDSGVTVDFSREFDSGFVVGAFFSQTDISKEEFGEGSFDKGWYFHLPIEVFLTNYTRGMTGFGLRPLVRDGAAILNHGHHLYGVSDDAQRFNILKDWNEIYK